MNKTQVGSDSLRSGAESPSYSDRAGQACGGPVPAGRGLSELWCDGTRCLDDEAFAVWRLRGLLQLAEWPGLTSDQRSKATENVLRSLGRFLAAFYRAL
jgi:hypothetical protein